MAVDQEMAVGTVFVLADPRLDQRRTGQGGKAHRQVVSRLFDAGGGRDAVAGGRIERLSARVVGNLEASVLVTRDTIEERLSELSPDGQIFVAEPGISGRSAEEVDLLPGRPN